MFLGRWDRVALRNPTCFQLFSIGSMWLQDFSKTKVLKKHKLHFNFSYCKHDFPSCIIKLARPQVAPVFYYLLLGCHPLLIPLSPGRVVDMQEGLVARCDASRSEQLRRSMDEGEEKEN